MKTRKIGTITHTSTGPTSLNWQFNPTGHSEDCHVQVFQSTGDATFSSLVYGTMESDRNALTDLTSAVVGDTLHKDVPNCPYMTVTVNTTVVASGGTSVYDVWVAE